MPELAYGDLEIQEGNAAAASYERLIAGTVPETVVSGVRRGAARILQEGHGDDGEGVQGASGAVMMIFLVAEPQSMIYNRPSYRQVNLTLDHHKNFIVQYHTDTQGRATDRSNLSLLTGIKPLYILPDDPLAEDVLIPCFQKANSVDCMMGFFSSEVLATLAPGLATFISSSIGNIRLIVSPMLREEDKAAIREGLIPLDDVAHNALKEIFFTEDLIQRHTLHCLTWLIRTGRVEIKVALMEDALFHPKVWLFSEENDLMAVHGSSNLTYAGIRKNIEQIAVSKSWEDDNQNFATQKLAGQFSTLWSNKDENCVVLEMPDAIRKRLIQTYRSEAAPTETDLRRLHKEASGIVEYPTTFPSARRNQFEIPPSLTYEVGEFAHQGEAVSAWCNAGFNGILEMATGSGKTITAMICAYRLHRGVGSLLIVVSAPYVPLIQQWCDEVTQFGLTPINLTEVRGRRGRARELGKLRRRLRNGTSDVEVIITSHRNLSDTGFQEELKNFDVPKLLIADEAHNLGSEGFISDPPTFFGHRLGLSATPVRQYDEAGTEALFEFLGPVVYRFTLEEAIGKCLVEYDYFVHRVDLTEDEMDRWSEITERIRMNSWRQDNAGIPDEYLTKLLRDRRAILEIADNKIAALGAALDEEDTSVLCHTLIYTSDKGPDQMKAVNSLLRDRGLLFHQLTYEETGDREGTRQIIHSFQDGMLKVLTAKRVLDEGVNIPQVRKAFILASTTVERQWVQRRGRLLRRCDAIGKTHSEIHDFVALPPNIHDTDRDTRNLVQSELQRVQEFAFLARNAGRVDGPLSVIDTLVEAAYM